MNEDFVFVWNWIFFAKLIFAQVIFKGGAGAVGWNEMCETDVMNI